MIKYFCDLCGNETQPIEPTFRETLGNIAFTVRVFAVAKGQEGSTTGTMVCMDCAVKAAGMAIGLLSVPGDNSAKG